MKLGLEGKVVLITGGASGMGRAACLAFAREGSRVIVVDIDEEGAQQTVEGIQAAGSEGYALPCDVSAADQVEATINAVVSYFGRLDCAFNNAGFEGVLAPTAECTEENWDRMISVNLKGVWLCMRAEIRQMMRQGRGVIVNNASVAALVAERGYPAYAAAKGGVVQLTRTAAAEYAGAKIRINAVCPGVIRTPMMDRATSSFRPSALMPGAFRSPWARRIADGIFHWAPMRELGMRMLQPMGRSGTAEEVADGVVWLCSDAASFVTGQALAVDGGMVAV
jgi:NAD(P)-dependent dehydrogenase (short-subunit alcohol dehydrogenase family)